MRIYIGHDPKEQRSFDVALASAQSFVKGNAQPLYEDRLRLSGMLHRPTDTRGQSWDLHSGAPQSTRFAIARFFTPLLAHSGWCLFTDGDVLFLRDPRELLMIADPKKAVMVVKHQLRSGAEVAHQSKGEIYFRENSAKMDGQVQTAYPRKLWSSVILWNVDHKANRRLNLEMLNTWPGRDLHAFSWLADEEIGELSAEWNWLVGMQEKPAEPAIAHYTLGTPELIDDCPHSDIWYKAVERYLDK